MTFKFNNDGSAIKFVYTNHRGETAERTTRPVRLYHGSTEWHPEPQWLLHAWDDDKKAFRDFALAGIQTGPAKAPKDSAAAWCEVMTILGSYLTDGFRMPIACEHDKMWICVPPDMVGAEHAARLEELGWHPEAGNSFWSYQSA